LHYEDARRYLADEGITELWRLEQAARSGDPAVPTRSEDAWQWAQRRSEAASGAFR